LVDKVLRYFLTRDLLFKNPVFPVMKIMSILGAVS